MLVIQSFHRRAMFSFLSFALRAAAARDSLVLARSDTVSLPGYLEMVEKGREVAATLKAVMVANAKDFVRAGFEARQGEGEVRCEGG